MAKRARTQARSRPAWTWIVIAVVAIGLVGGTLALTRGPGSSGKAAAQATKLPAGFPAEPDWYRNALQPVKEAYIYAANHHDLLQYIPCYCGCGSIHADNSACYFKRDSQDQVTGFDQHAYG